MKYAILLPVIGLFMVSLSACSEPQDGADTGPADVMEQPVDPAPID